MGIPDIRQLITVEFEVYGHVQGKFQNEKKNTFNKSQFKLVQLQLQLHFLYKI